MKRKLIILGIAVIIALTLLLAAALPYGSGGEAYNRHDYNAMASFLNQLSAAPGQTNAQRLGYDITQPGIWADVAWTTDAEKRLVTIGSESGANVWNDKSLAGSLNLSDCTALEALYCGANQLKTLNVSGCTKLRTLRCNADQLKTLDISKCAALEELHCNARVTISGYSQDGSNRGLRLFLFIMIVPVVLLVLTLIISHKYGEDWRLAVQARFRRIFVYDIDKSKKDNDRNR